MRSFFKVEARVAGVEVVGDWPHLYVVIAEATAKLLVFDVTLAFGVLF